MTECLAAPGYNSTASRPLRHRVSLHSQQYRDKLISGGYLVRDPGLVVVSHLPSTKGYQGGIGPSERAYLHNGISYSPPASSPTPCFEPRLQGRTMRQSVCPYYRRVKRRLILLRLTCCHRLAKATDENLTSEDWGAIMEVCDRVSGDPNGPKEVVQSLIKRLAHRNANVQLYTLEVCTLTAVLPIS
jgi:hypothetical protein